jgi:hypothetical protein
MSVKKHWPVAILGAGLMLTVLWIALVSWIPMQIISSLVTAYLGDIVRSFF